MGNYTKEQIFRLAEEENVEFIRLQFTDIFGFLKNTAVPVSGLERVLDNQCVIDASFISGFESACDSDLILCPDLSTFTILPWRPQQGKVARFICDLRRTDGTACESSSREILRKVINKADALGYEMQINPECDFFLFHTDDDGMPTNITHEKAGYMDTTPLDLGENARRDMVLTLEDMGYTVESSRHELAPAQHQIKFPYAGMMEAADCVMTFKVAVRTVARRNGLHATFMPKPSANVDGSGMHVNMRLMKDGRNAFYDPEDPNGLSQDAYSFIAGILTHIKGMSAVCNPLVNSYKRLITGFTAPFHITWSRSRRTALIYIPYHRDEKTTIELRSPDAASNPYLVFALCMAAGLEGIEKGLQAPPDINVNVRKLSDEEKKKAGIETLPANLSEALIAMEEDELVREVLGRDVMDSYIRTKSQEWKSYMEQISEWELDRYLYQM